MFLVINLVPVLLLQFTVFDNKLYMNVSVKIDQNSANKIDDFSIIPKVLEEIHSIVPNSVRHSVLNCV